MATTQYETVNHFLIREIQSGRLTEGEYLPPVEWIAEKTRTTPHAVRRSFRSLSDSGVLLSVKKKGTRVLRRPALGKVLFMLSNDAHTNLLLQEAVGSALVHADLDLTMQPFLFRDGRGFEQLRHLAAQDARESVLVTLTQEGIPDTIREGWNAFAAQFRSRVGFQFEESNILADSYTVLPDPVVEARLMAEHLLALGHRRVGVSAGSGGGAAAERRALALREFLSMAGAECHLYYYGAHAADGLLAFLRRNRCTAWCAINDFQAVEHILDLKRNGVRVPQDISVVGAHDTPWAMNGTLSLTTLSLDPPAVATHIADFVEKVFSAPEVVASASSRFYVRPSLVVRESTGPAPERLS